jgi:hypothetical protein
MALREFVDELGKHWQVWSTHPAAAATEERVRAPLAGGWLTFMAGKQRRRLIPIPAGWADAPDDDLRELLRASLDAPAFRRLP